MLEAVRVARHPEQLAMGVTGQPTVGSTRIVPPQCGQRPGRASGVALSVARPHAMQQARKRIRAACRCAAGSSAAPSSAESGCMGGPLRVTTAGHRGRSGQWAIRQSPGMVRPWRDTRSALAALRILCTTVVRSPSASPDAHKTACTCRAQDVMTLLTPPTGTNTSPTRMTTS
jgi:hypothetical protein